MRKKIYSRLLELLFLILIAVPSVLVYGEEKNVLKAIGKFLSGEPKEVQILREMEICQEEEGFLEYYFKQLTEEEKRTYREMLMGIREYKETMYLTTTDEDQIDRAFHALLRDHPELFWVHGREKIYETFYSSYSVFEPGCLYSVEEIENAREAIEAAWQEICGYFSDDTTDYQKVHTIYAWIIQNTDYHENASDQNIEGVFQKREAVCAGYAGAAQYLLERCGIPCIYVAGNSSVSGGETTSHAWNMVELDGEWYYMDVTNGDQPEFLMSYEMEVQPVLFDYLCPFPEDYEAISSADDEFEVPDAYAFAYNDAILFGGFFQYYDYQDVWNFAGAQIDQGYSRIRLKFETKEEFQNAVWHLIDQNEIQDIAQYYMSVYGILEIQYHYGMLEELNTIYLMF